MTLAQCREVFRRLQEINPNPTTELHWSNPFELLVAVMLSAQATDASVNKASAGLFSRAPDPAAMMRLGKRGIVAHIRSIGLYQAKAAHIMATCRILLDHHGGRVPDSRAALEALPGVGRKTANVVLNTAFGHPEIAVDTHIFRVCNRTGLAPGATPRAVEEALRRRVPVEYHHNAHHWLILHGRHVCKARRPECARCLLADLCAHMRRTRGQSQSNI